MAPFRPPTQYERTKCWRWMYQKLKTTSKNEMTEESLITNYLEEKKIKKWSPEELINFFKNEMKSMLPGEEELTTKVITVISKRLAKLEKKKKKLREVTDATIYQFEEEVVSEPSTATSLAVLNQLTPLTRSLVDAISKRIQETPTSSDDGSTDEIQLGSNDPSEYGVTFSPSLSNKN